MNYELLISILQLNHKTLDQVDILSKHLAYFKDFQSLCENLSVNKRREMCRNLRYLRLEPQKVIYKIGDISDRMFVVLSGNVRLFKDESRLDGKNEELGPGRKFGDEEMTKEKMRKRTAVASTDVECVYIMKKDYKRTLGLEPIANLKQKLKFVIDHFPFIKEYSYVQKERIAMIMQFQEYYKGNTVIEKDIYQDSLYFISHGEMAISLPQYKRPRRNIVKLGIGNSFGEEGALFQNITSYQVDVLSDYAATYKLSRDEIMSIVPEEIVNKWKELYLLKELGREELKDSTLSATTKIPSRKDRRVRDLYPSASMYARKKLNEMNTRNSIYIPRPNPRNLSQPQLYLPNITPSTVRNSSQHHFVHKLTPRPVNQSRPRGHQFYSSGQVNFLHLGTTFIDTVASHEKATHIK